MFPLDVLNVQLFTLPLDALSVQLSLWMDDMFNFLTFPLDVLNVKLFTFFRDASNVHFFAFPLVILICYDFFSYAPGAC